MNTHAHEDRKRKLDCIGDPLAALDATVDFQSIVDRVAVLLPKADYRKVGRPPFPILLTAKQLYKLSDDQVEHQALDRVTFQRFLGLQSSSRISDSKTF